MRALSAMPPRLRCGGVSSRMAAAKTIALFDFLLGV
jgi:hypothetical protein